MMQSFFIIITLSLFSSCSKGSGASPVTPVTPPVDTTAQFRPALKGKLVYHSYSCYSCNDSKMFLYDFQKGTLTELSKGWGLTNPMNGHISPDGRKIVFMGKANPSAEWDLFLSRTDNPSILVNLTAASAATNEDPKFSPDGASIIFKRNGVMTEIDTLGNVKRKIMVPQSEASMPYYSSDGKSLVYAGTAGTASNIYSVYLPDGTVRTEYAASGIYAYYPIVRDDTSYLFTRWYNSSDQHDQVYLGSWKGAAPVSLPFNEPQGDYSDAFPAGSDYVILSSTRKGTKGGYDLFVADIRSGKILALDAYNAGINTVNNELGACYR